MRRGCWWCVRAQRPSWNYRKAEGGGIILDMLCHWRYVLDNLFGMKFRVIEGYKSSQEALYALDRGEVDAR